MTNFIKKCCLSLGLTILGIFINGHINAQDIQIPRIPLSTFFGTQDYKGGMQNWALSENKDGLLYVANNYGLLEFNGSGWLQTDVPGNTRTRSLYVDNSSNRIYIGGQNTLGFLAADSSGTLVFNPLTGLTQEKNVDLNDVWNIHKVNQDIVFSTINYFFRYDGMQINVTEASESIGYSFSLDGKVLTYSEKMGLLSFQGR